MAERDYVFDNAWKQGRARLDAVEELLDPGSISHLTSLGVGSGWRCLEVGAGGGSIARWLSETVGPDGCVVATDIDTRYLEPLGGPNLDVRHHNLVRDDLEEGVYDLAHARLVLEHLPDRDALLAKLVRSLKPGGWLLVEAVDYVSAVPVSALGAQEHEHSQAVRLREFRAAGLDDCYGRRLPAAFRSAGLVDVGNEGRVWVMEGGSRAARWFRLSMEQVRGRLVGADKLTETEVDRMLELFEDPSWAALTPIILTAWARRPATA